MLALIGLLLQNIYGGSFWIFGAANTFFHLNMVIIADSWTGFCLGLLWKHESNLRRSHWNFFVKKGVIRNFANFTGKHLCCSLFSIELQVCSFTKKRLQHRCFLMESAKFLRTPNLESGNDCFWKLFLHLDCPNNQTPLAQINAYSLFSFCIRTYIFICQYSLATIDTAIISSIRLVLFRKEGVLNFTKFTIKYRKRNSGTNVLLWILQNFSKNLF